MIDQIEASCNRSGGAGPIPDDARTEGRERRAKILNIGWIRHGAKKDASIICPRSSTCPRDKHCLGVQASRRKPQIEQIRESIEREARSQSG